MRYNQIINLNYNAFRATSLTKVPGHLNPGMNLMTFDERQKSVQYAISSFQMTGAAKTDRDGNHGYVTPMHCEKFHY